MEQIIIGALAILVLYKAIQGVIGFFFPKNGDGFRHDR